jgi:hypothetical protein
MKIKLSIIIALTASALCLSADSASRLGFREPEAKEENGKSGPTELDSEVVEHVYTSKGLITTLHLATEEKIQDLKFGSDIITFEYESDRNLLHLMPRVDQGVTNMNMMIGGKVHVFIIHVESDPRVQYRRTFTMKQDRYTENTLKNAPIMQPNDVPVVKMIKILERVEIDPSFADQVPNLQRRILEQHYLWNDCDIVLKDVWQFPNLDTLVFRIQWKNVTNKMLYLHSRQYELRADHQVIPVTASTQNRASIYPGEMDEVYLFVQGHRLRIENNWSVMLPPDEESVVRMFQR